MKNLNVYKVRNIPGLFIFIIFENKARLFQSSTTSLMQELIEKLKSEAGLTEEQAKKAVETIKAYVVEKFPMLEGAVNNVFGGGN